MANRIRILIGTMTGTAELVAEEIQPVLDEAGFEIEMLDMDGLDAAVFSAGDIYLLCTSTYGQGDVPDNAQALFDDLDAARPDLTGLRYGVIGLGDSTYADTYNFGGKRFDELLRSLGGKRIGERMEHNASSDELPEEAGLDWVRDWLGKLQGMQTAA